MLKKILELVLMLLVCMELFFEGCQLSLVGLSKPKREGGVKSERRRVNEMSHDLRSLRAMYHSQYEISQCPLHARA